MTDDNSAISGAAIGMANSSGNAELTIHLEETNTVSASTGVHVYTISGAATLNITGDGSLEASGSTNGINVQSNSNKATLAINNAKVTATSEFGIGVSVQAGNSSDASLTVEGGSLTASGASGRKGILFPEGNPSLNVSDSAIVRASGGIASGTNENDPVTPSGVGIVFDGNTGTVYSNVTLKEDLEIGEGESLTIGKDASLTIPDDKTLTNKGEVTTTDGGTLTNNGTIDNSGTLPDNINGNGTVNHAPTITTDSLPNGTEGTSYSQTLTATGTTPITWSVTSGSLPAGLTLNNDGTITGTPTAQGESTFTVTATNAYGSDSKQYTLTIDEQGTIYVTSVSLNTNSLSLKEGETATLTAKVEPENATNKTVTWSSDNESAATVENGLVTAVAQGSTTITATAADGSGEKATCTVTVEKPYTPPPYIPPTYAVTVPETTGGTVEVSPSRASSGRRVTITTQPAPGYELESLTVLDSRGSEIALTDQGDGKYTFTMPAGRVTVEASFTPAPLPFEDVAPGAWYESAVRYAYFHDIMEGMSATTFQPNGTLSRAMAVQIFYNLEGQPDISGENLGYPYEDVNAQAWYGNAVYWARITDVATGYGDGTFQPGDSINRQEFAQMLYNYAKYKGYDLTAAGDLTAFPDGSEVQEWAVPAMAWANGNQLINGHDDGTLEPGGTTTRAQAAAVLMRFDQDLAE